MEISRQAINNIYLKHVLIVFLLLLACNEPSQSEYFYLPNEFKGVVLILFEQTKGTAKEDFEGNRIYRIPENGILYTQFSRVTGNLFQKFYYYGDKSRRELPQLYLPILDSSQYNKDSVYIMRGYDGMIGKTKYICFLVGKPVEQEKLAVSADSLINSINR